MPSKSNTPVAEHTEATGPWPFITKRIVHRKDGSTSTWSSRHHRKGLRLEVPTKVLASTEHLLRSFWMPAKLNWWIGVLFAIGSVLFAFAAGVSLSPNLARAWSLDAAAINATFFAGSIPFTTAAYLQLFQAANAGDPTNGDSKRSQRKAFFGWRPHNPGWLSSALQFGGTILFNVSTFDVMLSLDWLQQDLFTWAPNVIGSILFLASGYLAFIEACHAHWAWQPKSLTWWIVFTNLLGCIGFILSSAFAVSLPGGSSAAALATSLLLTLLGAVCFLVGSVLLLPEAGCEPED